MNISIFNSIKRLTGLSLAGFGHIMSSTRIQIIFQIISRTRISRREKPYPRRSMTKPPLSSPPEVEKPVSKSLTHKTKLIKSLANKTKLTKSPPAGGDGREGFSIIQLFNLPVADKKPGEGP